MRRASVEHIEKLYQSKADQARERRVSLTIMNCIWARNTERETTHPVHGEVIGKLLNSRTATGMDRTLPHCSFENLKPVEISKNCFNFI